MSLYLHDVQLLCRPPLGEPGVGHSVVMRQRPGEMKLDKALLSGLSNHKLQHYTSMAASCDRYI